MVPRATSYSNEHVRCCHDASGVLTIDISGDYGSIGAGAYVDVTETGFRFKAGYSYGAGADLIIEWAEY